MSIDSANIVTNANFEVQADTPEVGKTTIKLLQNINWVGALINKGSGDEALTISNSINLAENYIFDGDFKTIDMESNSCAGLFAITATSFANAPTVQNLNVIGGTTVKNGGFIVRSSQKYFIVQNCSSTGTIGGDYSGGIAGYRSGYYGRFEITESYSTGEISGQGAGGIVGSEAAGSGGIGQEGKLTITHCYSTGNITGWYSGGIAGEYAGNNSGLPCLISYCFSTGEISGIRCGGITGRGAGRFSKDDFVISHCYSVGEISGVSAGGIGGSHTGQNGEVLIIYSYSTGNITADYAGGITGKDSGLNGLLAITNSYTTGTLDSVTYPNSGEITGGSTTSDRTVVYNSYSKTGSGSNPKLGNNSSLNGNYDIESISDSDVDTINGMSTNISTLGGDFSNWDTINDISLYQTTAFRLEGGILLLTAFESSPWSGYSVNTSTPTLQASEGGAEGGAEGDPHIYPILGTSYDYHKLGWSRYFADHKNNFIINCYIEMGEGYWNRRDMSYISHTVIHYKNSSIYIDNGFRGRATKIVNQIINPDNQIINPDNQTINPDNSNIKIIEKTLPFDYDAKELCFNCCREVDDCWTNNMKCETDRREMIRNQIIIETDKHKITFQNVNKYNRNPGKINLSLQTMDPSYEGIIVSKEFANKSLIRDCEDKTPLSNYYTTRSI